MCGVIPYGFMREYEHYLQLFFMERIVLKLGMFETLMVAVIAIYAGEFLRNKIPVLKKYCLPGAVVGGTLFALL